MLCLLVMDSIWCTWFVCVWWWWWCLNYQSYFIIFNYTFINSCDEIRIHNPIQFHYSIRGPSLYITSCISWYKLHHFITSHVDGPPHTIDSIIFMHSIRHRMHSRLCCALQANRQQNKMNPIAFQMDLLSSHKLELHHEHKKKKKKKRMDGKTCMLSVETSVRLNFTSLCELVWACVSLCSVQFTYLMHLQLELTQFIR